MSAHPLMVRKVAVLGAGVMGAQIAAHLINARVPVMLFELTATEGDPNANVLKAVAQLKKLEPSPLAEPQLADWIHPANYDHDLELLRDCDVVIEAISERMDWKAGLYQKVAPYLGEHTIFASNTSGLSINRLAAAFPEQQRSRFCGVHFFNPPRYMHLVELIACTETDGQILDNLERFLVSTLGKGVVRAKDTPNFIANRVGVFSMLATVHHAARLHLGFDVVDALTGGLLGRPKSATFRTADVVGLDTFAHVVKTMQDALADDPWHQYYQSPQWLQDLIAQGALGQKTRKGIYQKVGRDIHVLDVASATTVTAATKPTEANNSTNLIYRLADGVASESMVSILKNRDAATRFSLLRASSDPQAQLIWSIYRDVFHYCAVHLSAIAHNSRDLDFAIRWGFGWQEGPFEIWQAAGWKQIAQWIQSDIAEGLTMANTPLPSWVLEPDRVGVHRAEGSYAPLTQHYQPRSDLSVYARQPFPDRILGEDRLYGHAIFETDAVRCWHTGDDIAIISFKSKMHVIGDDVLDGILQAIDCAEKNYLGLVIWQTEPPFSAGANLKKTPAGGAPSSPPSAVGKWFKQVRRDTESLALKVARQFGVADQLMAGKLAQVEALVEQFQVTTQRLKYSMIPTVAAVDGLALGGGCELVMHCDRAVASLETYIGLVEVGVGLLPAGGGCKEFALRSAQEAGGGDLSPFIQRYFKTVAMAEVARSAQHARTLGYLRASDVVVMNRFELLAVAKAQVLALSAGYRPPLPAVNIPVLGRSGLATLRAYMANMRMGGQISEHDELIGTKVATILCGGDVEAGSFVDEQWLLDLERSYFMELMATEKTQARIEHMLKTGKPLRN